MLELKFNKTVNILILTKTKIVVIHDNKTKQIGHGCFIIRTTDCRQLS